VLTHNMIKLFFNINLDNKIIFFKFLCAFSNERKKRNENKNANFNNADCCSDDYF
jgi:hypothetical protein